MGFSKLRKELKVFDKDKLISLIGNLYNKHRVVKNYLVYYLNPQEEALLKKYKGKVFDSSYTKNGIYSLKDARKAINDFKKHSPSKDSLADLQLCFVEAGVKFTNDFGDINEAFYTSLYKMYAQTLLMLRKQDRLEEFKTRAESIMNDTEDVGWGFHDSIVQAFYDYYADLDTEENEEGNSPG